MPREINPPPNVPVVDFSTPEIRDLLLVEITSAEISEYKAIQVGSAHPNTRDYSGYRLGKQSAIQGDEKWIRRFWVTDALPSEDEWNYALKYVAQHATYPIFIRAYRERKDSFSPRTRGAALTVVYKIKVTNGGSGYTSAPTISFTGGAGSGASATAVISATGVVTDIVLTNVGSGYTSAPAIGFSGGGGSGAAATAYIQPTGTVLVEEEPQQFSPDSPYFAEYFNVLRVYETLPGPTITTTRIDDDGATVTTSINRDLVANIVSSEAITGGNWLRKFKGQGDSVVAEQVQESRPIPGNAMIRQYPDNDGIIVTETKTLKAISTITEVRQLSGGTWTNIESQPVSDLVGWEVKTERAIPGTPVTLNDVNARGDSTTQVYTEVDPSSSVPSETHLIRVSRHLETVGKAQQTVETASANSTLTDKRYEKEAFGAEIDIAEDIISPGSVTTLPALDLTTWDAFVDHTRKNEARKVVSTVVGGLPTLIEYDQDEEYQSLITTTLQFALVSAITAPTAVAGVLTRYEKFDKYRSIKIVRTRANPGGGSGVLAKTRYIKGQYTFPTLLYGRTTALFIDPVTGATKLAWNPTILRARSRRVTFKVEDYFYTTLPSQDPEFNPVGTDYEYNGIMFDVSIPNAICNGGFNLQYSSSGIVETFTFGASPTTLTTYLTKVGAWTIITSEVSPWHDGFFLKRNTSLMFQE